MPGIPQTLLSPLRQTLMECDEFDSPRQLRSIFLAEALKPWQAGLPGADSLSERVDITISYLADKRRSSGENALVIFLKILGERKDVSDTTWKVKSGEN